MPNPVTEIPNPKFQIHPLIFTNTKPTITEDFFCTMWAFKPCQKPYSSKIYLPPIFFTKFCHHAYIEDRGRFKAACQMARHHLPKA